MRLIKKKMLIYTLFMLFFLLLCTCKNKENGDVFDVRGNWTINKILEGHPYQSWHEFSGAIEEGQVIGSWRTSSAGKYCVINESITFEYFAFSNITYQITSSYSADYKGHFIDKDHMEGTVIYRNTEVLDDILTGTWTADRTN